MRTYYTAFTLIIAFLLSSSTFAQTTTGKLTDAEKTKQLIAAIEEFNVHFASANANGLDAKLTEGYMHTNGSSSPYSKEVWLKYIKSRKARIDSGELIMEDYGMAEIAITFYGHVALVNGVVYSKGLEQGTTFDKKFRVTHLWVLEENQWKRAGFHDGAIDN